MNDGVKGWLSGVGKVVYRGLFFKIVWFLGCGFNVYMMILDFLMDEYVIVDV